MAQKWRKNRKMTPNPIFLPFLGHFFPHFGPSGFLPIFSHFRISARFSILCQAACLAKLSAPSKVQEDELVLEQEEDWTREEMQLTGDIPSIGTVGTLTCLSLRPSFCGLRNTSLSDLRQAATEHIHQKKTGGTQCREIARFGAIAI